ncbi:uncharacterized protein I206_102478 [Kwoniella pini CBS 10737]|uniref:CNH domain-containing protein n=1 Tax=Kwoniella pini CBS 10737 TaxID=1296096 RepID=A0A1B9I5H2_9TREE|nr:uncharacterized protein I206_02829 [Kwoniella pini CBS 10737]OCF50773.1 hypothetical protein I206_02829 [Kwoniella pini CBS 10737]
MGGFSIHPLLPSIKAKITAIHQYDDRLYVGLLNGTLQIYSYNISKDDNLPRVELLKTHTLGKRQMDQIGILGESNQIIILSDTVVTLYSLPELTKKGSIVLNQARSAHCFAHTKYSTQGKKGESSTGISSKELLVVGCRKKVVVYGAGKGGLKEGWELNLPHSPRTIIFPSPPSTGIPETVHLLFTPQTSVLLHINPSSSANRLNVSDTTTFPPPPSSSASLIAEEGGSTGITMGMGALTGLGGYVGLGAKSAAPLGTSTVGGEVLLARDDTGAFLSSEGNYTRTESLQWPGPPDALAFSNPHIYSVVPVLPSSSTSSSQTIPVPTVQIHLAPTLTLRQAFKLPEPPTGGQAVSHMINTFKASPSLIPAEVMNPSTKMLIVSTPTDRHLSQAEGSSIWTLQSGDIGEEVDQLVKEGRVSDAIGLVEAVGEVGLSPSRRLPHLKTLQAVTQMAKGEYQSAMEAFLIFNVNPALVLSLYPAEIISGKLHVPKDQWMDLFGAVPEAKLQPETTVEREDSTAKGILKSVAGLGGLTKKGSVNGLRELGDNASIRSGKSIDKNADQEKVPIMKEEDAVPPRAALEALMYFLSDRRQKLAGAMATNPLPIEADYPPLSSLSAETQHNLPSTPFSELTPEQLLRIAQVIYTGLIKVYLVARPVLVGSLCRIENWCDVEEVEELLKAQKKFGDLIDLYQGKKMHGKALKMLHELAKDEEDKLDRYPPTIRYLQKLGPSQLDLILESSKWIFEEDPKMGLQIFTADEPEVESLPRSEVMRFLDKTNQEACIGYLEHIIHTVGEEGPDFHDKLAELYHARVKGEQGKKGDADIREANYEIFLEFLQSSTTYRPFRLISKLAAEEMPEARAILLGRMGKHEEALRIYVYNLEDYQAAELYCVRNYPSNDEIFLLLLRIYLRPISGKEPLLSPSLTLLSKYSNSLEPKQVLDLLPPLITIQQVDKFLLSTIRDTFKKQNENKLFKNLIKSRKEELDRILLGLENKRIRITDQRICPQCHKRLGNSAIAVHAPRGEVTHLHCKDSFSTKLARLRG